VIEQPRVIELVEITELPRVIELVEITADRRC
jgi:hypothetical protein